MSKITVDPSCQRIRISHLEAILNWKFWSENIVKGIWLINCPVWWNVNWGHRRSALPSYSVPHIWFRARRKRRLGNRDLFCSVGFFDGAGCLGIFGLAFVARGPRCRRNQIVFRCTSRQIPLSRLQQTASFAVKRGWQIGYLSNLFRPVHRAFCATYPVEDTDEVSGIGGQVAF